MAFTDWDLYTVNNVTITPETTSPIEGLQSLSIEKFTGGTLTASGGVVASDVSGLTKGITAGRMRTVMKRVSGGAGQGRAGIYCMTSNENPTFSSADCYALAVRENGDIELVKFSTGIQQTSPTILTTISSAISDVTSLFTIELLWFYDITEFNGTRLIVKTGTSTDYSDLSLLAGGDLIDSATPLSSSQSEGPFYSTNAGTVARWLFDNTQLYSVSLV